jgi:glycosyltransferase involved in cell wall biosynthesis
MRESLIKALAGCSNPRAPRLLIVEEALRSTGVGHWYEYIKAITEGCRQEGVDVTVAAHQAVEPMIRQTLGAKPVLRYSAWERIYDSPSALKRYAGVLRHNLRLSRDVRNFLAQSAPFDCVLAPTNLPHHVLGWYWVARRCGGRCFQRLAMIFVNTPGERTAEGGFCFPRSAGFQRAVLRRFARSQCEGSVALVAETRRAARQFKAFCGSEFALFPHVVNLPAETCPKSPENGWKPVLGSFGFARHEKGSDLLQQAALNLLRENPGSGTRFVIQWGKDFTDRSGHRVGKDRELAAHPRVEFIDQPLSTAQYLARLNEVQGLVLPYRCRSYYDRVSRVAVEAACAGRPFIYPRNSWLADLAERCGAGVGFDDGSVQDLTRALREFVERIDPLSDQARSASARARRYFSPQRFKACLFGEPDELAGAAF